MTKNSLAIIAVSLVALAIAPSFLIPTKASTTGVVSVPIVAGPGQGDVSAFPLSGTEELQGGVLTSNGTVTVTLYHGTEANHTEYAVTGPIEMRAGVPISFADACFPVRFGTDLYIVRSNDAVTVGGFLTFDTD